MRIEFLGSTSGGGGCPTLFKTERGTIVVQGTTVTDPEALAKMATYGNGIPSYESAVEIPAELLPFVDVTELAEVELPADRPEFTIDPEAAASIPGAQG